MIGIHRAGGKMEFNPEPEAPMRTGDDLVLLGKAENLRDLAVAAGDGTQVAQ